MDFIGSNSIQLPKPNYEYITNEEDAKKAMNFLDMFPIHAIDTETTSLDPYEARWELLQIGVPNKSFVFDIRHDTMHSSLHPEVIDPILKDKNKIKILQNASYDMKIIKINRGYYLENVYDTMLVEQLCNLGLFVKAGLGALVLRYLGLNMPKEPRNTFSDYHQTFQPFQIEYAANDVAVLHVIRDMQLPKLKREGLENVADLEFRFLKPLCEMELNGICIDQNKWRTILKDVEKERDHIKKVIHDILSVAQAQTTMFGVSLINIDSNSQLQKALNAYGLELESTSEEVLNRHAGLPVIDAILDYRKANKLISTYGESLLDQISPYTGRLHTDFRQMVATGRMSSANPNLQNIPAKQKFRSCFVAKEGYSLLTADMSGAELRILGNLSQDPVFVNAYATGQDLHTRTAAEVFDVPYDKVEPHMRKAAKAINFGLCLSYDTDIYTSIGTTQIKDVVVGSNVPHDVGKNEVIDKKYMGEKEVFEIETKYGYTLEATADHLVKVITEKGGYVDKPLSKVDINKDLICIRKNSNLFSKEDVVFNDIVIEKCTNYKDMTLPSVLDDSFAAFLGVFVSEGSVLKVKNRDKYSSVSFGFAKSDREFVGAVDNLLYEMFGDRVSKPKNKYARFVINSVKFAEWLVDICDIRGKDKTNMIRIPECIKKSTKSKQVIFLKYLFEGDGTVKSNNSAAKIAYSSNSLGLVKDLQTMLLNFGILSSVTEEVRDGRGGYYILSLIGHESNVIFRRRIAFITKRKNKRIVSNSNYNRSSYFIGSHRKRMSTIIHTHNVSKQIKDRFYKSRFGDPIGNVYLKELSKYDDFFKFIYENDIVPLPIKSINSKGVKKVYDLSVDKHQYFLANGFVVHNCYGMSPVGLSKRLKITKKAAEEMINKYFNKYKGVKRYLDKAGKDAVRQRFSTTVSGRRRYYNMPPFDHPDLKTIRNGIERQGKNAGIQGANADTIKEAMCLLVARLKDYDARLILTVHDEIVVEVRDDQKYEVAPVVTQSLIDGFGKYFSLIPMKTDALVGPCWLKSSCENKIDGKECGCGEMLFKKSVKYGTETVCSKCGAGQE